MTKLRNIGYLRFASKIRQDFAVATPSLTPTSLIFPLWMLFAVNTGGGTSAFILGWGACRPPAGREGPPCDKTEILITYKSLLKLKIYFCKNDFEKYKNIKNAPCEVRVMTMGKVLGFFW